MDREVWHAAVHGVTKSCTGLNNKILMEDVREQARRGGAGKGVRRGVRESETAEKGTESFNAQLL